jgi:hypothetical protein
MYQHEYNGYPRKTEEREKGRKNIWKTIAEKFPNLMKQHPSTNARSSVNSKMDKYKESDI